MHFYQIRFCKLEIRKKLFAVECEGVRQFLEAGNIGRCSEVNRMVKNIRKNKEKSVF